MKPNHTQYLHLKSQQIKKSQQIVWYENNISTNYCFCGWLSEFWVTSMAHLILMSGVQSSHNTGY